MPERPSAPKRRPRRPLPREKERGAFDRFDRERFEREREKAKQKEEMNRQGAEALKALEKIASSAGRHLKSKRLFQEHWKIINEIARGKESPEHAFFDHIYRLDMVGSLGGMQARANRERKVLFEAGLYSAVDLVGQNRIREANRLLWRIIKDSFSGQDCSPPHKECGDFACMQDFKSACFGARPGFSGCIS